MTDKSMSAGKRSGKRRRVTVAIGIGDRIRKIRVERGLSQEFVAGHANISTGWFLQIENGQVEPRFSHVVAIARVLQVDLRELVGDEPGDQSVPSPRQQDATAAPALDLERLNRARQSPAFIDGPFLDQLESFLAWYWTAYHISAPTLLVPPVTAHVGSLWPLADETLPDATARRLHSLVGQAATLAGWLSLRIGNRASSSIYWSLAETLATEADDENLRRFTLASRSSLYTTTLRGGAGGDTSLALAFLDAADDHNLQPVQHAWTLARRAEEHAVRGDRDAAQRDLDHATRHLDQVQGQPDGYFAAWNMAQLAGYRGSCAVLLGGPEAVHLLENSLAATDRALISQRSSILANLGSAHARLDQVDEACAALTEALAIAGSTNLNVSIERIRGIRAQLDRWSDTVAVRRFDDLIASA